MRIVIKKTNSARRISLSVTRFEKEEGKKTKWIFFFLNIARYIGKRKKETENRGERFRPNVLTFAYMFTKSTFITHD